MNSNLRICLVNPPSPFLINPEVFPPLGLLTLSAYFKQHGYTNIKLINNPQEYLTTKADIFFCYCATANWSLAKDFMIQLKKTNITSKFILGGPHPSVLPQDCLWADSVVVGEGEKVSLQILRDYPNLKKFYIEDKIQNLDEIPFPDRDIIDIKKYASNYKLHGNDTTTLVTSRGCSYGKCSFCCKYWSHGSRVRYRSAQNIVDEIKEIQEKYSINSFMMFDDEFVSNKRRLKEFCELVKDLNLTWRCLARVDSINKSIISIMKDAGCVEIAVGIESADNEILKIINKNITIERAEEACNIIQNAEIDLKELFIIGLPGESHESLEKVDNFVSRTNPFDVDFTVLSIFPGSDIWEHPERYDIKFNKNCKSFYKGTPGKYENVCRISTSKLAFEEIVEARNELESKYKPQSKLVKKE